MAKCHRFERQVDRVNRTLAWVELLLCQILVAGFAVLLLTNVLLRYVFSAPLFFAEETAIYMLIWMTYLAAAASIARGEMVSLTILTDLLPGKLRLALQVIVHVLMAAMSFVLLHASINWLRSPGTGYDLALTLGLPKLPFYSIMALFFGLVTIHTLAHALLTTTRMFSGEADAAASSTGVSS